LLSENQLEGEAGVRCKRRLQSYEGDAWIYGLVAMIDALLRQPWASPLFLEMPTINHKAN